MTLALQPVAQAIGPAVDTGDAGKLMHELMDCGHVDPRHCVDFDSCVSGSHTNGDAKSRPSLVTLIPFNPSNGITYTNHLDERYSSYPAEILLRPPRSA